MKDKIRVVNTLFNTREVLSNTHVYVRGKASKVSKCVKRWLIVKTREMSGLSGYVRRANKQLQQPCAASLTL